MSYSQQHVYYLQALMTDHQAAAGILKAALGSRSARLTEQDYRNLIEQGFDSPEALLDARDKTLEASLTRPVAVDAVLAWQAENKPSSKWQCFPGNVARSICWHSPRLVRMPVKTASLCLRLDAKCFGAIHIVCKT